MNSFSHSLVLPFSSWFCNLGNRKPTAQFIFKTQIFADTRRLFSLYFFRAEIFQRIVFYFFAASETPITEDVFHCLCLLLLKANLCQYKLVTLSTRFKPRLCRQANQPTYVAMGEILYHSQNLSLYCLQSLFPLHDISYTSPPPRKLPHHDLSLCPK